MPKNILLFGEREDITTLERLLNKNEYRVLAVLDLNGVEILAPRVSAVVCESHTPDGKPVWKEVVEIAQRTRPSPRVVVWTEKPENVLWADILSFGGYDVLVKPFEREEVERKISIATAGRMTAD